MRKQSLSDAQLDDLFSEARAAEGDGRLDDALAALTLAAAELTVRGETHPCLFERMAQLESALGHHDAAEELALLAHDLELEAGRPAVALRVDMSPARPWAGLVFHGNE